MSGSQSIFHQFNPSIFNEVSERTFDPGYWQSMDAIIGQEQGRGTTWFFKHHGHELVLRHYRRGGLVAKINRDWYLWRGESKARSLHEFTVLTELRQLGLPVPVPAAAQVKRSGLLYQADLIIEKIPQAEDLVSHLQHPREPAFFVNLGAVIAQFHRAKVYHADLNIKNIMIDADQKFWLIDFDRAQLNCASPQKLGNSIKRLKRSFDKETLRHGIQFTSPDWQVFLDAYQRTLNNEN